MNVDPKYQLAVAGTVVAGAAYACRDNLSVKRNLEQRAQRLCGVARWLHDKEQLFLKGKDQYWFVNTKGAQLSSVKVENYVPRGCSINWALGREYNRAVRKANDRFWLSLDQFQHDRNRSQHVVNGVVIDGYSIHHHAGLTQDITLSEETYTKPSGRITRKIMPTKVVYSMIYRDDVGGGMVSFNKGHFSDAADKILMLAGRKAKIAGSCALLMLSGLLYNGYVIYNILGDKLHKR